MDALGLIFAYEGDDNMGELSATRTTSSIPFGGRYRVIDFMLSNLSNAGINDVGIIMQEGYQSLLNHIGSGRDWDLARKLGGISLLPPFGYMQAGTSLHRFAAKYRGKLDALLSIYDFIKNSKREYVVLTNGNLVTNIDMTSVFETHTKNGADITVVCTKKHVGEPNRSLYYSFGKDGSAVSIFAYPQIANDNECLSIYVMKKNLLEYLINYGKIWDMCYFEREVLRSQLGELKIKPYFFDGYVAKMESPESYYRHSMELLNKEVRKSLFNAGSPIYARIRDEAPTYYSDVAHVEGSLVADGCIIEGRVENSILFRGVHIKAGATVKNSIVMSNCTVGENVFINYVIADKNVSFNPGGMFMGSCSYPSVIRKNSVV